jgi:hypothetical protein
MEGGQIKNMKGSVFYTRCSDDERFYRTVYVKENPFTMKLQAMVSNAVQGDPPSNLKPIHPLLLRRLLRN